MKVGIIGGGAAGFFAAIKVKENFPSAKVHILEKTEKLLSKVKISGGGRCNVTNAEPSISKLSAAYPRGKKPLKKLFQEFNNQDFLKWLKDKGVETKTEKLGHVFPTSNSSQTIIDCFVNECNRLSIQIRRSFNVTEIKASQNGLTLFHKNGEEVFDKVIIATGGSPKKEGLQWLADLGHKIRQPIPSLFTFNMPDEEIKNLQGVVAPNARVFVAGTKLKMEGPILITHWGMSGPAILKLSAFGARDLFEMKYNFGVRIHWDKDQDLEQTQNLLRSFAKNEGNSLVGKSNPIDIPNRLWHFLISKVNISAEKPWRELGEKSVQRLSNVLCNDQYKVSGKTTFKEEFVTSGGISLESIDHKTLESKSLPGLYFAGEILDIDGITGGYNFQAAWTTAFHAAKLA